MNWLYELHSWIKVNCNMRDAKAPILWKGTGFSHVGRNSLVSSATSPRNSRVLVLRTQFVVCQVRVVVHQTQFRNIALIC